jgi:hypothetical protein
MLQPLLLLLGLVLELVQPDRSQHGTPEDRHRRHEQGGSAGKACALSEDGLGLRDSHLCFAGRCRHQRRDSVRVTHVVEGCPRELSTGSADLVCPQPQPHQPSKKAYQRVDLADDGRVDHFAE